MPEPQQFIGLAKEVVSVLLHPFGNGALTTNGVQYKSTGATSTEAVVASSTDSASATMIESVTVTPVKGSDPKDYAYKSDILEVEFALTAAFRSTTDTAAICTYKWQAKEADLSSTSWVDLTSWNTTAPGFTFLDITHSGYFNVQTNLAKIPVNIRLLLFNGTAGSTQAQAKTKSSSYVQILYRVS